MIEPEEHFVTVGIESSRLQACFCGQYLETRYRSQRNPGPLRKPLGGTEAHAHAGEASRTADDDNGPDIPEADRVPFEQIVDGGNEGRRVGPAGELNLRDSFHRASRQPAERNRAG